MNGVGMGAPLLCGVYAAGIDQRDALALPKKNGGLKGEVQHSHP